MKVNGSASAGRKVLVANFRWKTTVEGSGAETPSTMLYQLSRTLRTPSGGCMMCCQLAATSAAVKGEPSWNLTPARILKVYVVSSSVGCGIAVHRSQVNSVVDDGLSGL